MRVPWIDKDKGLNTGIIVENKYDMKDIKSKPDPSLELPNFISNF
jgi:hypothetical protein